MPTVEALREASDAADRRLDRARALYTRAFHARAEASAGSADDVAGELPPLRHGALARSIIDRAYAAAKDTSDLASRAWLDAACEEPDRVGIER